MRLRSHTIVPSLAALPFLRTLSQSERASDRVSFVRVLSDYAAFARDRRIEVPEDWLEGLRRCLDNARAEERDAHLAMLAPFETLFGGRRGPVGPKWFSAASAAEADGAQRAENPARSNFDQPGVRPVAPWATARAGSAPIQPQASADFKRKQLAARIADGDFEALIALASDPLERLRSEDIAPLVARARLALDTTGDSRLAQAILARHPTRLEMAPLFMEATSDQRWAIMLAAQRAELGRRTLGAFATVGREAIARLEYAAIAGSSEQFQDLLARAVGAPVDLAARIAADPTGEALVMALVAIGAPNDICVRVLTASDMRERGRFPRIHALSRLSGSASPLAARRILAAIVGGQNYQGDAPPRPAAATPRRPRGFAPPRQELQPAKPRLVQPRNANTVGAK
jgi:hypothetical protein